MSKNAEKISVYIKLINYILSQNKIEQFPKTSDIINYLNRFDYSVSGRTINRYINDISTDFDVDIEKLSHREGYRINKENSIYFDDIFTALQLVDKAFYFKKALQHSSKVIQYFSFYSSSFKGMEWIDIIIEAIISKTIIEIEHQGFNSPNSTIREIEPYLLKEYLDKWYVVGFDKRHNEIRSFGLDRILMINKLGKHSNRSNTLEVKDLFVNTIGLIFTKPTKVVLSFNNNQLHYFKSNPWREEYKILKDEEDELIVEMFVSINYELEQKILMHQSNIKVLEPKYLADRIIDYLKEALNQY